MKIHFFGVPWWQKFLGGHIFSIFIYIQDVLKNKFMIFTWKLVEIWSEILNTRLTESYFKPYSFRKNNFNLYRHIQWISPESRILNKYWRSESHKLPKVLLLAENIFGSSRSDPGATKALNLCMHAVDSDFRIPAKATSYCDRDSKIEIKIYRPRDLMVSAFFI